MTLVLDELHTTCAIMKIRTEKIFKCYFITFTMHYVKIALLFTHFAFLAASGNGFA